MKKNIISGAIAIVSGLLIALGPQFLFKVCAHGEGAFPLCHWSAQAEIGVGLLIAALGICFIIFTDPKTHLGLTIGIFLASIVALSIPHALIGGCGMMSMACRKVSFPILSVICIFVLVGSLIYMIHLDTQTRKEEKAS